MKNIFIICLFVLIPSVSIADKCSVYEDGSAFGSSKAGVCRKLGYVPADYDENHEKYDAMLANPREYARQQQLQEARKERARQRAREIDEEDRLRKIQNKLDNIDRNIRYGY